MQLVDFVAGGRRLAFDIAQVREIVFHETPTPLPSTAPHVRGVISLRGTIIPVIDLASLLALGRTALGPNSRLVVVEVDGRVMACEVDEVTGVIHVEADDIAPAPTPTLDAHPSVAAFARIDDTTSIVLDADHVLDLNQLTSSEPTLRLPESA